MNPDRVPASSPEKNFKLKQRSASFGIQRNSKLNKDSQTEFFLSTKGCGEWLSLIQKNLRPVQMCILCAVREELTYICRVCLTKFILCSCRQGSLSSVSGREEFILCFRQGRVYPLFQAGKSLSSKVLLLEMKVSSVSGREESIL